jgi:hypothetical protein
MEMKIQVRSITGEIINGAEVFINNEYIGKTPNISKRVSTAIWKKYYIKVKCEGYSEKEIEAVKEPKILMLGSLWSYGPKELQVVTLTKKNNDELKKNYSHRVIRETYLYSLPNHVDENTKINLLIIGNNVDLKKIGDKTIYNGLPTTWAYITTENQISGWCFYEDLKDNKYWHFA